MTSDFKIINKKKLHDGFFKMNEFTLTYKKYDGQWSENIKREVFGGSQVAAVLPYDPVKNEIILVQQFRPGTISKNVNNYVDEIVAGIIDHNEEPISAAKRECFEETGCNVKKITPILEYFPSPGSSESYYHLFLGEIETITETRIRGVEGENEDIFVKSYKVEKLKQKLIDNKIINGLTLIALQWFFLNIYKN